MSGQEVRPTGRRLVGQGKGVGPSLGAVIGPGTRPAAWERRRPLPLKVAEPRRSLGETIARLAEDLLCGGQVDADRAVRALDHFREDLRAVGAVLWLVEGSRAEWAIHAGRFKGVRPSTLDLDGSHPAGRVAPNSVVVCREGDWSGLERLAPVGARSFAAAAAGQRHLRAVLVVGWEDEAPPVDEAAAAPLRTAATLLANAVRPPVPKAGGLALHDAMLESLRTRIAVVDARGSIVAVNASWTRFTRANPKAAEPGMTLADACRTFIPPGSEAETTLDAIRAVATGALESFERIYPGGEPGEDRGCLVTVTPLRRPEGGAVIALSDLAGHGLHELSQYGGEQRFHQLADAIPVPVWRVAPSGLLRFANLRWRESFGRGTWTAAGTDWAAAVHPDDARRARTAHRSAVTRRSRLSLELRLKLSNGSYRWYGFVGIPQFAPDDTFDGHLGMCVDVSAKRRAESALKTVAGKLVAAQEEERNRVARELHDDIGQQVALLLSGLDTLLDARRATGERMRSGLEGVRRHLHELASSVHSLSHRLHPAKLRLLGLIPTLAALCRDVSAQSGIDVRFDPAEITEAIPGPVALCLFRVTQEALQNAVKHSGARRVHVTLAKGPRRLTLRITDKGKGFDPLSSQSMGLGLLTMRERVELSGGRLRLETGSGRGTTIEAMVPVTDDDAR